VDISPYDDSDKEGLVSMYATLSHESLRWSMPPYDRQRIDRWIANRNNSIIIVAKDGEKVVGHLQISVGTSPRFREMGDLFIYLHQDYQNIGLGTALIGEGIKTAKERRLHRVELTVVADNQRAIHLYEKTGFHREGLKRENYLGEDGKYHDEIIMGILL
jgi:L-phenylalanine/L-methionine N-acetyltransferase